MKRSLGIIAIIAAAAATASAGEVQFFLSSPASTNAATTGPGALAAMVNPVIDTSGGPGSAALQLWMYLDAAQMAAGTGAGGTYGVFGGGLDMSGAGTHTIPMTVNLSGTRWPAFTNAPAGPDYNGLFFLSSTPVTVNTANGGEGPPAGLFLIGNGNISWGGGEIGSLNIKIPGSGAIGANNPGVDTAVGGFGFSLAGGAYDNAPPSPEVDPGTGTGWILADASGSGTVSVIPDLFLTAIPEPASMTLLAIGALILRRRR